MDSLAVTTEVKFNDYWQRALNHIPMKKCNITEEPDGYLRDVNITKADSYISDFNYTCNNTGFNYSND